MAQLTGYVCDICSTFSLTRDGWLKVSTFTENRTDAGIDVCSNRCLSALAKERIAANGGGIGVGKSRRTHSDTYKAEVVALCKEEGHTVTSVARDLGLSQSMVWKWVRAAGAA